ncbi:hypothetical protein RI129_006617 [Pyrocoelia pectoralis]|uniref:Acyl-coenzyme A oxidase n=1 Tax=Pyrocoelia pectoralis TaxID=417401 RepID=A0AAN7ZIM7_9COLE
MAEFSSFDWKIMQKFILGSDLIKLQDLLFDELQKNSIFLPSAGKALELDELYHRTVQRAFKFFDTRKVFVNENNTDGFREAWLRAISCLDKAAGIQEGIFTAMFLNAILGMGTERHLKYSEQVLNGKIVGAFSLTEIAHGSNTKMMQTEAVYDKDNHDFVLKTPNFEAAKCWSGNVGKFATHVILYAQLIIPGEGNYGLHAFVVPIRSTRTLLPYPGLTIANMGDKIGLRGIDNGVLIFNNYRIPKENLLNKIGDVNEEGKYVRQIVDVGKQYATSLSVLTSGRIGITATSTCNLTISLVITFRYLEKEKKIGQSPASMGLIPYVAAVYVSTIFYRNLFHHQKKFMLMVKNSESNFTEMGMELHAISSATKPVFSWLARDAIQKCMEACNSLGFHSGSGLDQIKANHEINCTYEGDNNVLIQQTANWLIKLWPSVLKGKVSNFPLESISFLDKDTLNSRFNISTIQEFANLNNILKYYRWLITYLLKKCYDKYFRLLKTDNVGTFWAKNENQVYFCKNLSVAYIEHYIIQTMGLQIQEAANDEIRSVLDKLLSLYAMWNLQKYVQFFYEGGYANGPTFAEYLENAVTQLCENLKNDQMALINAIAPPDFFGSSILGHSQGQIYERMESAILQHGGVYSKPKWGMEVSSSRESMKSKL